VVPILNQGGKIMNTKLVESLVQIVRSLTPEEQVLFEAKLKPERYNWQEQRHEIHALKAAIFARRGGKPFDPPLSAYIQEARDERNAMYDQVIRDAFTDRKEA
jgi:hypothetical protein